MTDHDSRTPSFAADDAARERALDIGQSFLVQAPAGSGKTGLLIQRFLALLAHVDRPERIVAMTFTRKAAGEMRERIVSALREATTEPPAALTPHAARTRELARAVLAQDAKQGWQLVLHPSRLSVSRSTLAAALLQQAPLATVWAAPALRSARRRYVERRAALARAAARDRMAAAARAPRQRRGPAGRPPGRDAGEARPVDRDRLSLGPQRFRADLGALGAKRASSRGFEAPEHLGLVGCVMRRRISGMGEFGGCGRIRGGNGNGARLGPVRGLGGFRRLFAGQSSWRALAGGFCGAAWRARKRRRRRSDFRQSAMARALPCDANVTLR